MKESRLIKGLSVKFDCNLNICVLLYLLFIKRLLHSQKCIGQEKKFFKINFQQLT